MSHRPRIVGVGPLMVVLGLMAALTVGAGALITLQPAGATAKPPAPDDEPAPPRRSCSVSTPCLAIVIDDVGRDLGLLRRLLRLRADLTFSVLPDAAYTRQSVELIRGAGRELMLHLPMAPQDRSRITDETVVLGQADPLEEMTGRCLAKVPRAVGVNNHMGSALSNDPIAAVRILKVLRRHGMWFLDSRTTPGSQLCQQAKILEMKCVARDIFLDDPHTAVTVHSRFKQAEEIARGRGWAVAIGHPSRMLAAELEELLGTSRTRVTRLSNIVAAPPRTEM